MLVREMKDRYARAERDWREFMDELASHTPMNVREPVRPWAIVRVKQVVGGNPPAPEDGRIGMVVSGVFDADQGIEDSELGFDYCVVRFDDVEPSELRVCYVEDLEIIGGDEYDYNPPCQL